MLIFKRIFLPGALFLLLAGSVRAGHLQQTRFNSKVILGDTSLAKDSTVPNYNDPKHGFQDLFVSTQLNNGVSLEQMNPLAISFVQDYMDRFGKSMESMKSWGKPYFDMMDGILTQHGLPKELKYLAVIESYLKSSARSWAGAVGPWQLMPETAKNLGLKVTPYYDERTDYFKSTHAACRYLTSLFSIYGDWLLVIAAYNGGPGNVNIAIKKSGSSDFWVLQKYLPLESQNHVKKFIATHYIMEGQGGVTTSTKDEIRNMVTAAPVQAVVSTEDTVETTTKVISGRYSSAVIMRYVGIDLPEFNKLNPDFEKEITDNGKFELRLPNDKMDLFLSKKYDILYESLQILMNTPGTSTH